MYNRLPERPLLTRNPDFIQARKRRIVPMPSNDVAERMAQLLVGQPEAIRNIAPFVRMYQAGLSPEGRPVGVFLLLGPTGTGKTRTVESLAHALHGDERSLLRIDCGEFQMEHEVAKLIGAPPGYLGHRETQPMLTQARLNAAASERSSLSLLLFDEIEKSAASMARILLGVLDKAALRLGDGNTVNFERSMIFLTSNLGAREMMKELTARFGFGRNVSDETNPNKLESIAMRAVRKRFAPEFVNRLDRVITYKPLSADSLQLILERQIREIEHLIHSRMGPRGFSISLSGGAKAFLLQRGTSTESGARELRRVVQQHVLHPIAEMVTHGRTTPQGRIRIEMAKDGSGLSLRGEAASGRVA